MVASQFFPCRNGARVSRASRKSLKLYFYLKSPDLQMLTTNGETKTLCRPPKVVSIAGTQLATSLQHGDDMTSKASSSSRIRQFSGACVFLPL